MTSEHKYITKLKHGWQLKIGAKSTNYFFLEYFADKIYGKHGLDVAIAKRDQWLEENPAFVELEASGAFVKRRPYKPRKPRKEGSRVPSSGHRGVYKHKARTGIYFVAVFRQPDGSTRSASFSTQKYGEEMALKMAVQARTYFEENINGLPLDRTELIVSNMEELDFHRYKIENRAETKIEEEIEE